jgi:hypothetical protein
MSPRSLFALSIVAALSFGCDKSGSSSGSSAADAELMKSLPGSSNVVFGGDFMKVQKLVVDTAMSKVADGSGGGMKGYVECFSKLTSLHVAGGVSFAKGKPDLRVVMSGVDIPTIAKCATDAGFKVTTDPDGKFLAIEIAGAAGTMTQGYLALANGTLYSQQQLGMRHGTAMTRAELEAEAASASKASAADDPKIQAMMAKADRGKMLWFAGNAAGTSFGDKVGEIVGSLDVNPDVSLSVDVQITDPGLATTIDNGVSQARQFAGQLPGDIKTVVEALDYKKDGDHLHFALKATVEQIKGVFKTAGGMLGGLGR